MLALRTRYSRFEPAAFFFGGVVWDATTLRRIDALIDNVFLSVYLVVLGALIVAAVLVQSGRTSHRLLLKYREALPAVIQFFMGALFSAYVVYYFQSSSWTSTSVFLFLLLGLLVANEFVHRKRFNVYLLFGLYYLAAFSFFVFFVPVVTKTMTYLTFMAGGILSLGLVAGMLQFLRRKDAFESPKQFAFLLVLIGMVFALMNLFYLKDWIPPVPLALRHAGIYHDVSRNGDVMELQYENPPWYRFWIEDDREFHYMEGDAVHCFAAVFAPTRLRKALYHEWSYFDEGRKEWVQTDRMRYEIEGLRDTGYRWYSRKRNLMPGRWRVDIRTSDGRTLGRVGFQVEAVPTGPREMTTKRYE